MRLQALPLGEDPHLFPRVSGPVNGGYSPLHSQRYTQAGNGFPVGVNAQKFYQVFKDQALPGNCFQKDGGGSGLKFPLFSLKLCFPVGVICYSASEKVEQEKFCYKQSWPSDHYVKPGIAEITPPHLLAIILRYQKVSLSIVYRTV